MILPNKNNILRYSILGASSKLVFELENPQTISSLWEKVRIFEEINTFEKYVLSLDFLYIIGLINLEMGLITLNTSSTKLLEFDPLDFIHSRTEYPNFKKFINFSKYYEVSRNDIAE
jgi:hypothetical protein